MVEDIASIGGINCRNRIGKGHRTEKFCAIFFFHFSKYEYQWLERSAYKVQHSAQVFRSCPTPSI